MSVFNDEIKESFILHVPHSSTRIPDFSSYTNVGLVQSQIDLLTDWGTDKIFKVDGVDSVVCDWSRVFCDVERLVDDPLESSGYGIFYTHTDDGVCFRDESYKNKIVEDYYNRYHARLTELTRSKEKEHGVCYIVDCHSYPNEPFIRENATEKYRPDVCIGTNENTPKFMLDMFVNFFVLEGYDVGINQPFSGAIIPQGCSDTYSIMIEFNRNLYMLDNRVCDDKIEVLNRSINDLFELL